MARGIVPPTAGDGTYRVDPFIAAMLYERVAAGAAPLARVEAEGPKPAGYRVALLQPDDALARLGLQEGDVIEALNGIEASSEAQLQLALDAAENRLTVTIFREDLSFTNSYRFDGGLAWRDVIAGAGVPEPPLEDEDAQPPPGDPSAEVPRSPAPATPSKPAGGPKATPTPRPPKARPTRPSPVRPSPVRPTPVRPTPKRPTSSDIGCTSASACTITQRKFDDLRASPTKMQAGTEIVPAIRNDVFSGYKLKRVSGSSPVHQLGFRSGDKVTHVNGRDLTDDAQAMALYFSLGSSKLFKVRYERGGRRLVKTIRVI